MADLRTEVMKALPFLSENILSLLLVRLDELGVEGPHDMRLVEERDLSCVLKVIQCRKLINHFKTSVGYSNSWIPTPSVSSKAMPDTTPFINVSPTASSIQPSYASPFKNFQGTGQASYAYSNTPSQCAQSETVCAPPAPNNKTVPDVTVRPFKVSPAFTISEPSSTSEDPNSVLHAFVTSSTVTNNYAPFNLESDIREATPIPNTTADSFESISNLQATNSVKIKDASEGDASSYVDQSASFERVSNIPPTNNRKIQNASKVDASPYADQSASCNISAKNCSSNARKNSDELGDDLLNYQLPTHKFSADIQNILKNKKEIRKPFLYEFARIVTADLVSKCSNPTIKEMSVVAKAAVNAYPDSLRNILSGKNNKPGFESFLNMICNRINNMKYSAYEKSCTSNEIEPSGQLKQKRPVGRPKGCKRSRLSENNNELKMGVSSDYSTSSSRSAYEAYQIPLTDLPQEIQGCLEHGRPLSEPSKCLVIRTVVDDLLKVNNKPTQDALKTISRSVVTMYPGSLNVGKESCNSEFDFLQALNEEIKKRDTNTKSRNEENDSRSLTLLAKDHDVFKNTLRINLVPCEVKPLTPFERWNTLRNYKVPLSKLPLYIQKDLKSGILIEDEIRDEFISFIIQDAMEIVSEPTRDDLKVLAKAVVKEYPNSLQMRVKSNRFTYLGFLKKVMEIAVCITGDESLAFSIRGKKCIAQNKTCDDDNLSLISTNEMQYYLPLKTTLQTKSKNEEWSNYIADAMSTTFPLQRLEIENGVAVPALKDSWPFLFHEKGFLLHLRLLLGNCLKKKMEINFRDKHNALLNYFVNQSSKQEDIQAIISEMLVSDNIHSHNRRIVLLILDYFGENPKELVYTFQGCNEDFGALPTEPCIVTHPSLKIDTSLSMENTFSVFMKRTPLVRDISFTTAFIIYFGTYLVFKLRYPPSLCHSLEFVQRCIAEIPLRQDLPVPKEVSEKVAILLKSTQLVI